MDPGTFVSRARVLVVTGKGGTGKTTVSAVLANLAARHGLCVLIVQLGVPGARTASLDDAAPEATQLGRLFGRGGAIGAETVSLGTTPGGGEVRASVVRPDEALVEYLHAHGMRRLSRRLATSGALDVVATAVPGMPDMLVLGKLKQMERASAAGSPGSPDLVILDAPATGHAVRFLQSPHGLLAAAAGGPVRAQAQEVVEMLADPERCQVVLVTTPEETPVSETVETAYLLEDRAGAQLAPIVVNGRFPVLSLPANLAPAWLAALGEAAGVDLTEGELTSLAEAGQLRARRQEAQAQQVRRLAGALPLPQLELPFCFSPELGPAELQILTDSLAESIAGLAPAAT